MTSPLRKRKELSLKEKVELLRNADGKSSPQLAEIYGTGRTQVHNILSGKERFWIHLMRTQVLPGRDSVSLQWITTWMIWCGSGLWKCGASICLPADRWCKKRHWVSLVNLDQPVSRHWLGWYEVSRGGPTQHFRWSDLWRVCYYRWNNCGWLEREAARYPWRICTVWHTKHGWD